MTKNRNLRSLCLVFNHASPQLAGATTHTTPATSPQFPIAQSFENTFLRSEKQTLQAAKFSNTTVVTYATSKTPVISIESAILREGIVTPVSPHFPSACTTAHGTGHQQTKQSVSSTTNSVTDYFGYKKLSRGLINGQARGREKLQKVTTHDNFTMPGAFPSIDSPESMDDASYQRYVNDTKENMLKIPAWIPSPPTGSLKIERYVSLSNLPTPPPSDSSCSPEPSPGVDFEDLCNLELIGPAQYLAELIPKSASACSPSIPILRSMLHRANLRVEIVALAGIILDTLSSQFVRKWRTELSRYSLWEDGGNGKCELLVLVALGVAMKFLDDKNITTGYLSEHISSDRFCPQEINITERLMLVDIDYALSNLSADAEICWAVREIQWCCRKVKKEEESNLAATNGPESECFSRDMGTKM